MNREIKFRAWDKENGFMFIADTIFFSLGGTHVSGPGVGDGWSTVNSGFEDRCSETIVLMQSTSLLDKHGKEIYEGDVVKTIHNDVCQVGWHVGYASFTLAKNGWLSFHWFGEAVNPEDVEIVGNIYENPDLL